MSELLVEQARSGSEPAFGELATRHRRELHVHCYRMLGSFEDAEDAVQETLLRAWSRISTYSGASTFRAWLYAIATNVCLDALPRRKARAWPTEVVGSTDPYLTPQPATDVPWLQPYPDALLVESAEQSVVDKESVELAFLAAIQHLPPRQRAVLILRDVLDWSAKETAAALSMTPVAVNSALQRAHATMADRMPERTAGRRSAVEERAILDKLVTFWERADLDGLVGLLAEDARFVMPPRPTWFSGRVDVARFLGGVMPWASSHPHIGEGWRLVPTAANGQPAFGLYRRPDGDAQHQRFAIGVLQIGAEGIEEIALFLEDPDLFDLFDLPEAV